MIGLIYEWLKVKLPIELVDIIISYHHELMYRDVLNSLRSYISSYCITVNPHFNNSIRTMSRLVYRNLLNNHLIIVNYYYYQYQHMVHNRYNYYDYLDVHIQKTYKSNKKYHMSSDQGAMNKRREWLHGMSGWTKEQLLTECKKNNIKAYKSWKNVKLIQALLKA